MRYRAKPQSSIEDAQATLNDETGQVQLVVDIMLIASGAGTTVTAYAVMFQVTTFGQGLARTVAVRCCICHSSTVRPLAVHPVLILRIASRGHLASSTERDAAP